MPVIDDHVTWLTGLKLCWPRRGTLPPTSATEAATAPSKKIAEITTAATREITTASSADSAATSTVSLTESTSTYKGAIQRISLPPPSAKAPIHDTNFDARVRAREGIKGREILVDAVTPGSRILDNTGWVHKDNLH